MKNELKVLADLNNLEVILDWVRGQIEETDLSASEKKCVELALEEAVVNIIMHAAKEDNFEIQLSCKCEPKRQIAFQLKDLGSPFNPLVHSQEPQLEASLEDLKPGGLGLSIMRKYMDALLYRREDDQNILTLIKIIHSE